jgi:hypothetical protein
VNPSPPPTVGRVVHYVPRPNEDSYPPSSARDVHLGANASLADRCRKADVAAVLASPGRVVLHVNFVALLGDRHVAGYELESDFDGGPAPAPGTWHYPPSCPGGY